MAGSMDKKDMVYLDFYSAVDIKAAAEQLEISSTKTHFPCVTV